MTDLDAIDELNKRLDQASELAAFCKPDYMRLLGPTVDIVNITYMIA